MSRGRGLPVTLSAAKRTFATQKGACVMDSGVGSQTRWEGLRILDVLTPLRAGVMGSGRECQLNGRLRYLERGDTLVVVPHQA
jgi:hypothetical protein